MDETNPYRRNLILVCVGLLIYFFGEGSLGDSITIGLIGVDLHNTGVLRVFALIALFWTALRYHQNRSIDPMELICNYASQSAKAKQLIVKEVKGIGIGVDRFHRVGSVDYDFDRQVFITDLDLKLGGRSYSSLKIVADGVDYRLDAPWPISKKAAWKLAAIGYRRGMYYDNNLVAHNAAVLLFGLTIAIYIYVIVEYVLS